MTATMLSTQVCFKLGDANCDLITVGWGSGIVRSLKAPSDSYS